jgi:predicted transcriptional regulator
MTQATQILAAMRKGAETSAQIAISVGSRRGIISVALCRLADNGAIERHGSLSAGRVGRPYVRWRTRAPAQLGVASA